jgi:hypothetical protein
MATVYKSVCFSQENLQEEDPDLRHTVIWLLVLVTNGSLIVVEE